jgi:hypothetical protein
MVQILGVQPVAGFSTTKTHDTTGSQAPILHIEHTFFQQAQEVKSEVRYMISGQIQVKNLGSPMLKEIYVFLHLDHEHEVFSEPFICYANGDPVPPGPGSVWPAIYFGDLPQGGTSPALTYYWTLRSGFSNPVPDSRTFEVTPILIPQFRVSYPETQGFDGDTTTVRPSS